MFCIDLNKLDIIKDVDFLANINKYICTINILLMDFKISGVIDCLCCSKTK